MSDLSRDDWYGRALSVHTGLGSGTVLQCLYRLENWGWLESRWEDRDVATRDGRPPRRFYRLTGLGQREATALLAERFKGQLRFAPGGGVAPDQPREANRGLLPRPRRASMPDWDGTGVMPGRGWSSADSGTATIAIATPAATLAKAPSYR